MKPLTRRAAAFVLACGMSFLVAAKALDACTGFCATGNGLVLVGNHEDSSDLRTKVWFVPAEPGSYGRMYVGVDEQWPYGGMNERGLWFDGFAVPTAKAPEAGLPPFQGNIVDRAMAECSTVEDVVRLFSQYDRRFLSQLVLMFADASGDAVSIEVDTIIRKTANHFVQTNFHQSRALAGKGDHRFRTANDMLERAGGNISVDLFRRILAATYQKGSAPTLYSNVYELRSRTMYLYHFHDFERAVTFRLDEELRKGAHVLDIPSLFPPNADAATYARRRKLPDEPASSGQMTAGLSALVIAAIGLAIFGLIRGGRRVRLALLAVASLIAIVVGGVALLLNLQRQAVQGWADFSLAPASGTSTWIGQNGMRSEGMLLKSAIATAYDVPSVRVIGPDWLAQTRYAISATVPVDSTESFRTLLQQELDARLRLRVHTEMRPFDVFVLRVADASRLHPVEGDVPRLWVFDSGLDAQDASMERIAGVLQGVLSTPVIDETGLTGNFELEIEWTKDLVPSVTAALAAAGLRLEPSKRQLQALVVDDVRRDASLVLLDRVGDLTGGVPVNIRRAVANMMTIR